MAVFSNSAFDNHEAVHAFHDADTGLKGFIAIHSTFLGPSFGGCRLWAYDTEEEALTDALRLSQGMSYKNALAGIPYGGGKAVIIAAPDMKKSPELFRAFGRAVNGLGGKYLTAEDVGVSVEDMRSVAEETRFVSGLSGKDGLAGGDPSPKTAYGVFLGIRAAAARALGRNDLDSLRVAVQGAGHVGYHLCKLLSDAGARISVADINQQNVDRVSDEFNATPVDAETVLTEDVDVVSPCALGGVINAKTIPELQAKIVAGAANNQLLEHEDGERLRQRGILYAPDYVINAGGIISVAAEFGGGVTEAEVDEKVARIESRVMEIFDRASQRGVATSVVADDMAREAIGRAA